MNLKALILGGGRGKRLENVTSNINKCMLLFKGNPLISYSLKNAIRAKVSEIIIVVGYRAEDIINYFGNTCQNTRIKYVIQKEQKGIVHAIECARDTIDGSDFMTFLGDEILLEPRHKEMMELFYSSEPFAVCGVTKTDKISDISKTYAIIQDQTSSVYRLIEKPRKPLNNIMGTGNCIFKNGIFDFIPYTPINHNRGEKELVDLIQCSIDEGHMVKSFNIGSGYININTEEDIAIAEKMSRQLLETEAT
jgi:dTDP-glucose pyrophosphorylase